MESEGLSSRSGDGWCLPSHMLFVKEPRSATGPLPGSLFSLLPTPTPLFLFLSLTAHSDVTSVSVPYAAHIQTSN